MLSLPLVIAGCIVLLTGVFDGIPSSKQIEKTGIAKNVTPGTTVYSKDKKFEQKDQ